LSPADLATIQAVLRDWMSKDRPGPKANRDMADIVDLMLATQARIGEVLALRCSDIELDDAPPTISIDATIKTETGKARERTGNRSRGCVRTPCPNPPWRSCAEEEPRHPRARSRPS